MSDLAKRVREYALAHYNEDGWDFVVECWSDQDILDVATQEECLLVEEVVEAIRPIVKLQNERRQEQLNEIF